MQLPMGEINTNGNPEEGFYKHKETGAVVELKKSPGFGTPLINAFMQAGFVYVGNEDPCLLEQKEIEVAKSEAERILDEARAEAERIKAEAIVVSETKAEEVVAEKNPAAKEATADAPEVTKSKKK
jgi:hypothetical protein